MARRKPQEFQPAIRWARYDRLTLFEISEDELDQIERGSPESIFLTFSTLCFGVFVSFLVSLLTTEIPSITVLVVFVVVDAVAAVSCMVLFSLWLQSRRTVSDLIQRIRKRLPPDEGQQETVAEGGMPIALDPPSPTGELDS